MDFAHAGLLALLIFVLVAAVDKVVALPPAVKIPLAFALGILVVVLVAASDFSHEQVVMNRPLDTLNGASQVVVGLLLGALATGIDQGLKAVRNIGENQG